MSVKLTNNLPRIARSLEPHVTLAVKRGAEQIAEEARSRVPVGHSAPHLRDTIRVVYQGHSDYAVQAGGRAAGATADVFYAHMVENGTVRSAPHPFLLPAFEAKRREINRQIKMALKRAR